MDLSLINKNALVCGSTQGIGKAAAIELALLGAGITLVARNEDALKATVKELDASKGQKHSYICADFNDPQQLKQKIEKYAGNGIIHILVNNTGGPPAGAAHLAKPEDFSTAFSNHLVCNHILAQALIPGMKKAGYGRIINIISTSVKQPIPGLGVSNTIRAAVANWSKTLSLELASSGITVNNVLPGAPKTRRLRSILKSKAEKNKTATEAAENEMLSEIPMKRFATANEIANAVAFLASPAASYITGINVPVDGGRTGCL